MRGTTTLILHSLDPESLDRVDDLDSLDPESDEDDPYKEIDAIESELSNRYQIPYEKHQSNQSKINTSSQSSLQNVGHTHKNESHQFPIFDLLRSDLSTSPPLTKSNYQDDDKETRRSSQSHNQINDVMSRLFHSYEHSSLQSDSMKEKTFTSSGSGLPLSRVKPCRNEISSDEINLHNEATAQHGLARFLNSIGLRQNKSDRNRFNVHTLPPQLKEELKHIYVY